MNAFEFLRNTTFIFATLMLVKYFVFLVLAPFYPFKEKLRKLKWKSVRYNPLVSVVIPAWNEEVGVTNSINSLIKNTYQNIEVIVVDDGSQDKTSQVVKATINSNPNKNISIKLFQKENGGKGSALSYGIERVSGEIIVTMDADSAYEKHAIERIVEYFKDPEIDAIVGNVKVSENETLVGSIQKLEYLFGFYFKRAHAVMGAEYIFGGACAAFRKSTTFDKYGLFDTTNKTEDIEMSMRLRFFGINCTYAENVLCYTEGASSILGLVNQRLRWKKGRFDTFMKYRRMFFSLDRNHNKFLSWFILPYSLLAEIQLLFEPLAITLLAAYSFISGDYLSLALGSLFVFVIYFVSAIFGENFNPGLLISYFYTWPLFYFLVWIEYLALMKSLKLILRGEDITWQKWDRVGIKEKI
ncbi:hypothetical protein A2191_02640 [Candidatus Woesebacteria bacterium RIFOXYA1_FULL_38_9]|nr:MAG: hypothetical protein A2191_02640 [Candidatus Woesebacteria bacterium RIFOXYA1_FULL_38_9]